MLVTLAPEPALVLTRRARSLRVNPGDIALPGGAVDPGETDADAATREAHEELGIDPSSITMIGRLDDAWSGAGFNISTHVGSLQAVPRFVPSPNEVDEVLVAPIAELAHPHRLTHRTSTIDGRAFVDPMISIGDLVVYGVTADLILDLTTWLHGADRRQVAKRTADLEHFAKWKGWT